VDNIGGGLDNLALGIERSLNNAWVFF